MAVFESCAVVLELKHLPYKEKKRFTLAITDNGGSVCYVVNKQCTFVVASSWDDLSSSRQRSVKKHQIPVVGLQYVWDCLEKRVRLPVEGHALVPVTPPPSSTLLWSDFTVPKPSEEAWKSRGQPLPPSSAAQRRKAEDPAKDDNSLAKIRVYTENDLCVPEFPRNFQVARYSVLEKVNPRTGSVLELQSAKGETGQMYRVVCVIVPDWKEEAVVRDKLVHCSKSEEALEVYLMIQKEMQSKNFVERDTLPPEAKNLGSQSLQQLLLEEKLSCSALSQEVGAFVELVWTEAIGCLGNILTVPFSSISLNDVSRAEGLLLQAQRSKDEAEIQTLFEEVNSLLPHRMPEHPVKAKLVSQKLDLCQLIRDMLNVSETTMRSVFPSCLGKYRALRCSIDSVPAGSPEFHSVQLLLQDRPIQIMQVFSVRRGVELQMFREELGNIRPLLHSTSSSSFVGILSRGLLLPRVGVEQHGIERTDIGFLGSGIYFSDSLSTSVKYSKPSVTDGSRLLLVCEVALGRCRDLQKKDTTLTSAPKGYHSVHGVRRSPKVHSEFEDDEYVVYSPDQVKIKYVVQYTLEGDQMKTFQPHIDMSLELTEPAVTSDTLSSEDSDGLGLTKNPLETVTAGLLNSSGETLPLQAVHVRSKLMDLLCQVIIFQTYTNNSASPIEAKYVFPLEETAAVCGFEAFINGKHVVGKVKEKEQARKEYKQAIQQGHGAYLMDQDAPDVFTISVGNLPPGATVLIKVTFITELVVKSGSILFSLPGSVAPWEKSSALNQRTQTTVEKVCVDELTPEGEFSLCMSVEMPYEITDLTCVTHRVKIKRTDCKAVVSTLPGETLGSDGFQLSFGLSQIHMPRMWVENHPEKDSQACMLVFYPDFETSSVTGSDSLSAVSNVIILLDTSESMRGEAMLNSRRIALQVLKSLDRSVKINVVSFGTDYKEAFPSQCVLEDVQEQAKKFIMTSPPVGGSTELWRTLRSLSLLPPSRGVRNLLLLSDGHVQNQAVTLQLVRDNVPHTRLFTCGLSSTANRHMLRTLAQVGGGAYEFFDTKTKHTWTGKVSSQVQRMVSPGCSSVCVKWQQFNPTAPSPLQAPAQLQALFSNCHALIYGFVPHCTQATLLGNLSGQEIKTMVSTTELQKTRGTFLHKLTARAIIRDYEDGNLDISEAEHEEKKAELKSYIIQLSKEFSVLSQFTSFVAIEERDQKQQDSGFTDIPKLIAKEDVDFLPYMDWQEESFEELFEFGLGDTISLSWSDHLAIDGLELEEDEDFSMPLSFLEMHESSDGDFGEPMAVQDIIQGGPLSEDEIIGACALSMPLSRTVPGPPPRPPASSMPSPRTGSGFVPLPPPPPPPPLHPTLICDSLSSPPPFMFGSLPPPHLTSYASSLGSQSSCSLDYEPPAFLPIKGLPPVRGSASPPLPSRRLSALSSDLGYASPSLPSRRLSALSSGFASAPPPLPSMRLSALSSDLGSALPPLPLMGLCAPPPTPPPMCLSAPSSGFASAPPPLPPMRLSAPPPPPVRLSAPSFAFGSAPPPLPPMHLSAPPPPPPPPMRLSASSSGFASALPPLPPMHLSAPSPPPPPMHLSAPSYSFASAPPPLPPKRLSAPSFSFGSAPHHHLFGSIKGKVSRARKPRSEREDIQTIHNKAQCLSVNSEEFDRGLIKSDRDRDRHRADMVVPMDLSRRKAGVVTIGASYPQISEQKGFRRPTQQMEVGKLFDLQHQDGYWECTGQLRGFLGLDIELFANVFLKERGICSLGLKAHADILRLLATLLVLQLLRVMEVPEGKLLQSLFRLKELPQAKSSVRWEAMKRAVKWACWADRQYPCVCSRLEFGVDWESSTRQLLGFDALPSVSPLIPVLKRTEELLVA